MSKIITPNDDFKDRLIEIGDKLNRFVIPVFLTGKFGRPEMEGTGFFLRHNNKLYFVTASHIIDAAHLRKSSINVAVNGKIINLENPVIKRVVLKETEEADKTLDIAIIQISENFIYYETCSLQCIDSQKTMYGRSFNKIDIQLLQGFPVSKNKPVKCIDKNNKTFNAGLWTYSFRFYINCDFKKFNKNPSTHYSIVRSNKIKG